MADASFPEYPTAKHAPAAAQGLVGGVPGIDEVVEPPDVEVDEVPERVLGVRAPGVEVEDELDADVFDREEVDVVVLGLVVVVRGFGRAVVVGASVVGDVVVEVVREGVDTTFG